jgi:hypothetical protein
MDGCLVCGMQFQYHTTEQLSRCHAVGHIMRMADALEALNLKIERFLEMAEFDRDEGRGPWRGDRH